MRSSVVLESETVTTPKFTRLTGSSLSPEALETVVTIDGTADEVAGLTSTPTITAEGRGFVGMGSKVTSKVDGILTIRCIMVLSSMTSLTVPDVLVPTTDLTIQALITLEIPADQITKMWFIVIAKNLTDTVGKGFDMVVIVAADASTFTCLGCNNPITSVT